MPGPSEGFQSERERLLWTNTVSGCPLRTFQMPDACHPLKMPPSASVPGRFTVKFMTNTWRVSKSDRPLL